MTMIAEPSVGKDFSGVQIELRPAYAGLVSKVRHAVPGACVSIGIEESPWGARVYPTTTQGNMALGFFWDHGWKQVQSAIARLGIVD
jgi:hypothetical protein